MPPGAAVIVVTKLSNFGGKKIDYGTFDGWAWSPHFGAS